ncbi:MAG TPA: exodeoxyribonuclease VII large subunit [Thermodesulfobacteriota bacterium]|nr:exodeoxyribonuclease VII large subunit [Thermodesulfobacteriota bacterium]
MEDFPSFQGLISGDIFTVSQINERIKLSIEDEFGLDFVWIVGEISNFRGNYSSGHWYFTLKDENTQISAVCFKWANQYIKFNPENGMEVICCGQINVYEKQGSYQINIRYIEPKGIGAQALALEQLKEKLFAEGLFDESRKRELPFLPETIGIVTSPTGAAIKDILKVLDRRFADLHIIISPAGVQGKEAAADIVSALNILYKEKYLDEIIVARGGGSKEDLMVFNEESVVRAIAKSPVPVISAVGHEIDITLTDLVADVRAATPSMAAEIAVREKADLVYTLDEIKSRLLSSLVGFQQTWNKEISDLYDDLTRALRYKLESTAMELGSISGQLDALSPLKVLDRGYSITQKIPGNKVIKDSKKLQKNDEVLIRFLKGTAKCKVEETKS